MSIETEIKNSDWWRMAREMPDRHYDPSENIYLADHLEAVARNLRFLQPSARLHEYFAMLRETLAYAGFDLSVIANILTPAALLHDIGKTGEDKAAQGEHPLTGKPVKMRHPIVSVTAALELLPDTLTGRDTILALIEEHDTPYSWYMQFRKTAQVPKRKSWARLDRKIDSRADGTGLVLLSIFKLADIDGHANLEDVSWFIELADNCYLREKGKWLPVPDAEALQSLARNRN